MILTDEFVYVHVPKTGGTFVTNWLDKVLRRRDARRPISARLVDRIKGQRKPYRDINKHGPAFEIPASHQALPIVGCIRGPYERYHSQWRFGWWRKRPPAQIEEVAAAFPSFPELSFEEWFRMVNHFWMRRELPDERVGNERPGLQTRQFLWFFGRDPANSLSCLKLDTLPTDLMRSEMFLSTYLRTDHLNDDLKSFLSRFDFTEEELEGIIAAEKIQPPEGGRSRGERWEEAYTPELRAEVRRRDALIFELFPEYDV